MLSEVMRCAGKHVARMLLRKASMPGSTQANLQYVVCRYVIAGVAGVPERTKVGQAK